MKTEYKKIYELVNNLNFSCNYIRFKYGFYSLKIYSKDYFIAEGKVYSMEYGSLKDMREAILNITKQYYKTKIFTDEEGNIYKPTIKENKLFMFNGVNELR